MAEQDVTVDAVEREHLAEVDPRAHWAYLATVIVGGTIVMLALIAWMGAAGS